ncbi:MAG: HAMP domain-containing protein [Deltaproteobacteria bacterium]|nr:HAMP domain-containing protein [Deltaproteobacteria bacterium]
MTLRAKLLLAQAPLAVALVLVCLLSVVTISSLGSHSQTILKDNYRSVLAVQRMLEALERLEDSASLFLLKAVPDEERQKVAEYRRQFDNELKVQEGNITEHGEEDVTQRLRKLWLSHQEKFDHLQQLSDPEEARRFYFAELEPTFHAVKTEAETILAMNQDAMVRKSENVRRIAERLNTITSVAMLGVLLLGLFLSITFTRRLLRPLAELSQATHRIGEGDFTVRAEVRGTDELAHLASDFNTMASHLSEYRNSSLGELLQVQQAAQAAIDSLPDPVVVFGIAGDVRNVNRAAETLLGLVLESYTTDPLKEVEPSVRAGLERLYTHVLSGKGPYTPKGFEEAVRVSSSEGDRYLLPRAIPVYEPQGGIVGATVILQDVTRLRRFDELKNDMMATVAHEFRTPLTSLRMAIHLCLEQAVGPVTEKQADLLYAAREDCERLQAMVDDLLDLSRIETGRVEMRKRPTSITALMEAALETHRVLSEERGVPLVVTPLPVDEEVLADPERVALVLSNLVSNALRHTPTGGQITLRAQPADGWVRFEVSDTGAGIPEEYRSHLFEKFFRVPGTLADGAGLGLFIAKEIVDGHGGEIGVKTEEGQGSTFWFTLPLVTGTNLKETA